MRTRLGMLEPQAGKITEYNILTPTANPFDIAVDSKGISGLLN